jgi:hypothetical protein
MKTKKKSRCRHERNSWIIGGGAYEWCYVCGAFRRLQIISGNESEPYGKWIRPSGDKGNNPTSQLDSRVK